MKRYLLLGQYLMHDVAKKGSGYLTIVQVYTKEGGAQVNAYWTRRSKGQSCTPNAVELAN